MIFKNLTIWNLEQYLSIFEKKANQIIDLTQILESKVIFKFSPRI